MHGGRLWATDLRQRRASGWWGALDLNRPGMSDWLVATDLEELKLLNSETAVWA